MTIQNLELHLINVYERRKADLALLPEARERLLLKKYPKADIFDDALTDRRIQSVASALACQQAGIDFFEPFELRRLSDQLYLEHGLFGRDSMR